MTQKNILLTAPGGGIGKTLTQNIIAEDYQLVTIGRANSKLFIETLDEDIFFVECSYTDPSSVKQAFNDLKEHISHLDGLVHTVGGSLFTENIEDITHQQFREVIEVNLDSSFLIAQQAYKWMMEEDGGNIVIFGSTTGIEPSKGKLPYGAAKAAVHHMVRSFALEGGKHDIFTNAIAPAYVMTPRHRDDIEEKVDTSDKTKKQIINQLQSKNTVHRILDPEDLIPVVDLLLQTKSIQGQIMNVDLGQVGIT